MNRQVLHAASPLAAQSKPDRAFEKLAARYVDEMPALSPIGATQMGDHRFDGRLDEITEDARAAAAKFLRRYHDELLSFGSPGVQCVRALMLGGEIPH